MTNNSARHAKTLELLRTGKQIKLRINTITPGVLVPQNLSGTEDLCLQIGLNMRIPIPDLVLDDAGISGTLSFSYKPTFCVIPWQSLWGVDPDNGTGVSVFDVDHLRRLEEVQREKKIASGSVTKIKKPNHLRLVKNT
jgi:hypothetical protein